MGRVAEKLPVEMGRYSRKLGPVAYIDVNKEACYKRRR
jgi:hypothetical protein